MVELMVAAVLGIALLGAIFGVTQVVTKAEPKIRGRSDQVQLGRALVERIDRELRQAYRAPSTNSSTLTVYTYVRHTSCGGASQTDNTIAAIPCQVTYSCASGACTRAEVSPGGTGGTAVQAISGLASSAPFSWSGTSGDPDFVGITLVLQGTNGGDAITISDGVNLRNVVTG